MAKLKDKDRVLAYLLMLRNPETGLVYQPPHLLSSLRGISEEDFYIALEALEEDKLIHVQYAADLDESDDIFSISFSPQAFYRKAVLHAGGNRAATGSRPALHWLR